MEDQVKREIIEQNLHNVLSNLVLPDLGILDKGKVRDNYVKDSKRIMITSDRISAFDFVLRQAIPFKGQVLNQIAAYWFDKTKDIIKSHLLEVPDPNVVVVKEVNPIQVEMVVRGYITGSAWRDYADGKREKSGVRLSDGMRKNQKFDKLIITPTTKSKEGHDMDISKEEIIGQYLVPKDVYEKMEEASLKLFEKGQQLCEQQGLILVDTKYEFGVDSNNELVLIDEIHTPDSSRFWYKNTYEELFVQGTDQKELSKEFIRKWLIDHNFSGQSGQVMPDLTQEVIIEASFRYIELYEKITGQEFKFYEEPVISRVINNLYGCAYLDRTDMVIIIAGSEKDSEHIHKLTIHLALNKISYLCTVFSAHKNTSDLLSFLKILENSKINIIFITCAGRSNALSGVVTCNSKFPVVACPVFSDLTSYSVDIHSTLRMPSKVPFATILEPENAILFVKRIFDLKFEKCIGEKCRIG